jgi:hypothetical protein
MLLLAALGLAPTHQRANDEVEADDEVAPRAKGGVGKGAQEPRANDALPGQAPQQDLDAQDVDECIHSCARHQPRRGISHTGQDCLQGNLPCALTGVACRNQVVVP